MAIGHLIWNNALTDTDGFMIRTTLREIITMTS